MVGRNNTGTSAHYCRMHLDGKVCTSTVIAMKNSNQGFLPNTCRELGGAPQMPNENSTPTSMSRAILTTFENCTDFSAALCRSSIEKILRPELFTCDVVSKR